MKVRIIFLFFSVSFFCEAQGIFNNGANINTNGSVQIYIDGGNQGNYLSQNTGSINSSANCTISLEGNWINNSTNNGFGNDAGTVVLNGASQSISGTNSTIFYNLSLQGTGIKSQNINAGVGGAVTKTGVLSLGNVIYDLNTYTLNVRNPLSTAITYGSGYILSEINAAVNPSVIKWDIGTTTGMHTYPFGVGGLQIPLIFDITTPMAGINDYVCASTRSTSSTNNTPWAGVSNVAAVTGMFNPTIGGDGSVQTVIDRWWDISSSNSVTANVTFSYRGIENTLIAPYNTGMLGAQHWNGTGWDAPVGVGSAALAGVGSVTAPGLNTFSPWVLSSAIAPLPIELTEFKSSCFNNSILISWSCATEIDNEYFTLEKSINGSDYKAITTIKGAGTSYQTTHYNFTDAAKNLSDVIYYRLKQTNIRNSSNYFNVISQAACSTLNDEIKICSSYEGKPFILFDLEEKQVFELNLYDMLGRLMAENYFILESGLTNKQINTSLLANGYYVCSIRSNNKYKAQKVYVKND